MDDDELMPIGRFAHLTGLTIHALRHYDDVALLHPAQTDPDTGYRRYARDQARVARLIADLRWLDLPIEEIRVVLADPHNTIAAEVDLPRMISIGLGTHSSAVGLRTGHHSIRLGPVGGRVAPCANELRGSSSSAARSSWCSSGLEASWAATMDSFT